MTSVSVERSSISWWVKQTSVSILRLIQNIAIIAILKFGMKQGKAFRNVDEFNFQQQQLMFYVRLQSPIFLLLGAALHWLLLLSFVLCSFLLVCLLLLLLQLLLLGSDGFQVTGNEQVNKLLPFLVGLQGSSKDLDFSGQEPEDSGNSPGNSVVAWNDNIDVLKRSISVAEGNGGDIDIGGFNDGLSVVLGVSDDEESGLLELLGGLIGQGSRDPPGGG